MSPLKCSKHPYPEADSDNENPHIHNAEVN